MGNSLGRTAATEVDAWLRGGGRVVAASERAARAVAESFNRARRAEELAAWPAPSVEPWNDFVRNTWEVFGPDDDRLVLNPLQERALWAEIVACSRHGAALLESPLQRMAKMASDAHALLCAYAPGLLRQEARSNWQLDAAAFSGWLAEFDQACASGRLVSAARLPLELLPLIDQDRTERVPLLLTGFDRIQPIQAMVLDAWGEWRPAELDHPAEHPHFYAAMDEQTELIACVQWCKQKLEANPAARLLVVTRDLPARRGELERAFLRLGSGSAARVEFSLGVPLGQIPFVRAAHLLLRWLTGPIEEHELDWLLGCGFTVSSAAETHALTGFMCALRRRGWERTHWGCREFMNQRPGPQLPAQWAERMQAALQRVETIQQLSQLPMSWAEFVPDLLQGTGWPGDRGLTSEEFQALQRWQRALDLCASLGFDGRRLDWREFLIALGRLLEETLFAPESQDATVVIAGPLESAGLGADALWFMGANEDEWPAAGSLHPLLPIGVQRDFSMPHATAQLDWNLAKTVTMRLLASAPNVSFSYARQVGGVEMRASRLAVLHAGEPQPIPAELAPPALPPMAVEVFEDFSRVPLGTGRAAGGSAVLSYQSQCPFKAFATTRLSAEGWQPAEAGLNARQRGVLLHEVMHSVWGPSGIRSLAELKAIADLKSFAGGHVHAVLERDMPAGVRERMPQAYLALEEERLTNVVTEWLEFERSRAEFSVEETEAEKDATVAGLTLKLRMDRIDRLNDGKLLVVDYKTSDVSTKSWDMPRPDDVQLPLYAGFALGEGNEAGGLVFAKVRTGKHEFTGYVKDAVATLLPDGIARKALAKNPLSDEQLEMWRDYIEDMARDFLAGRADVDPIDRSTTCKRCELQTLCRIEERPIDEAEDEEEARDE